MNESIYQTVREMSEAYNTSMTKIIERAVDAYRNEMLLKAHNEAWARLMEKDPGAIDEFEGEHELWNGANADGMKPTQPFVRREPAR